jgi:hypothetical protein
MERGDVFLMDGALCISTGSGFFTLESILSVDINDTRDYPDMGSADEEDCKFEVLFNLKVLEEKILTFK